MSETRQYKSFHYETALEWQRRRHARAMLPETVPIDLTPPVELGGEPGRWTPEQLLLSAVEACTLFTFLDAAARQHLEIASWESTTEGTLARGDDGRYRFVQVVVRPVVHVHSAGDAERVRELLQQVETRCFIGNSLETEPRIEARVEPAPAAAEEPQRVEGPSA